MTQGHVAPLTVRERLIDESVARIIARVKSPHAGQIYLAVGYTKADLIRDLDGIRSEFRKLASVA